MTIYYFPYKVYDTPAPHFLSTSLQSWMSLSNDSMIDCMESIAETELPGYTHNTEESITGKLSA